MNDDLQWGKKIETEVYYDGKLSGFTQEIEESHTVDHNTVLKHIIDGLKKPSDIVHIEVRKKDDEPERVVVRYKTLVDKLGRNA